MIVISMKFLAGRFHATPWERHVNESSLEYPPSSWRLLRALVATFYRTQPEGMTTEQLTRILDALSAPPAFHLPPAAIGHTRHYDVANKGKHFSIRSFRLTRRCLSSGYGERRNLIRPNITRSRSC
jgi:CRISPR-associated protein Csb2